MVSAQGIKAGAAYVEISTRDSKLIRGLKKAQQRLKAFGGMVQGLGVKMLALGGSVAGPLSLAIKSASDMEETMNKFNVVFGVNSKAVKQWGDLFGEQVGRSKQQVADFLAGTQDLLVPIGFDDKAATSMSKQLTGLAVDLASFNNKADADVLRDLHAALTGSGEVMKKYGVIVSETAVKQELLNQGIDKSKATEQQKVMARWSIILRGTTAAQGDAIRSAGSFANQMKALRASIGDAAVEIGSALLPVVTPLVTKAVKVIKVLAGWAKQNKQLVAMIFKIAAVVLTMGAGLVALGATISAVGVAFGGIATVISAVVSVVGTAFAIIAKAVLIVLSPVGLVVAAVVGLAGYLLYVSGIGGKAIDLLSKAFESLKADGVKAWKGIANALAAGDIALAGRILWDTLREQGRKAIQGIHRLWTDFTQFFLSKATSVVARVAKILNNGFVLTGWTESIGFISETWSKFTAWLTGSLTSLRDDATAAWKGIADALAAGDIQLAGRILWLSLKVQWQKGVHFLNGLWSKFKQFFLSVATDAVFGAAKIINDGLALIEVGWTETIGFLADAWSVFTNLLTKTWNHSIGFIRKAWVGLKGLFDEDVNVEAEVTRINQEVGQQNATADDKLLSAVGDRDTKRRERRQQIEQKRDGVESTLSQMQAEEHSQRETQFAGELSGTESELAKARREWQAAIAEAAKKPKVTAGEPEKLKRVEEELSLGGEAVAEQQKKLESAGTFNAFAARGLSSDSLAERTAKASEQTADNTKRLLDSSKQGKLVFAP